MGRSRLSQPLPWYQWNPTQWQGSRKVQRMDWAARGLYRELMDECWIKGSVPSTVNGIAELFEVDEAEIEPLLPQIIRCFEVFEDGTMVSPFIEEIRTEVDSRRVIQANRRLGKDKHGNPRLTTDSKSEPQLTDPNQGEVVEKRREEKRREEKEVPLQPSASASPSPSGKKERKPRKVQTTGLKPGSIEAFQAAWDTPPKSFRKWSQETRDWFDDPISKGSRLEAERNFQAIVDSGVASPKVLYAAFHAYVTEGDGPAKGFFQAVSTFYGPQKATYLQWVDRGAELIAEQEAS